jgi:hypothetical protein
MHVVRFLERALEVLLERVGLVLQSSDDALGVAIPPARAPRAAA